MTELYLIRHAEAEGNLFRRINGVYNAPLTPMGKQQKQPLAERFRNIPLTAVYSSDLLRAMDTAEALSSSHSLPLHTMRELREVNMGIWEDECWGLIEKNEAEQYWNFSNAPAKWSVPGGEPWLETQLRMRSAILRIAAEQPNGCVAVVSHGSAIRILLTALLGYASEESGKLLYCDNTAVAKLLVDGTDIQPVFYNDSTHLPPELSAFTRDSWWKTPDGKDGRDLFFLPFPLENADAAERYLRRYRETWICSYGKEDGFGTYLLNAAKQRRRKDENSVLEVWAEDRSIGVLELDREQGVGEGFGHIALLALDEEYRHKGLGIQLIGQASSYYQRLGRTKLRLRVAVHNLPAQRFYRNGGFTVTGTEKGLFGDSYLMVRDIGGKGIEA